MNCLLITSVTPGIGMLSAFIAILIGQHIDEKKNLKESHLFLLVMSIALLLSVALSVALDTLLLVIFGGEE